MPSLTVSGNFDMTFTVTVHDSEALHAYMALYPEDWPDERTIWSVRDNVRELREALGLDNNFAVREGLAAAVDRVRALLAAGDDTDRELTCRCDKALSDLTGHTGECPGSAAERWRQVRGEATEETSRG